MRDGVGLHVSGKPVQFVGHLPDRDRVAQQLARRACGRQTLGPRRVAHGSEVPVDRGRARRHELVEHGPVIAVELPARAQHGQPLRQHRLQILAARHVHQHPHLPQQLPRPV